MSDGPDRIPAGDQRRGQIHPGEFTARGGQGGGAAAPKAKAANSGTLKQVAPETFADLDEHEAAIVKAFGSRLKFHLSGPGDHSPEVSDVLDELRDLPAEHLAKLHAKGVKIAIHDAPLDEAYKIQTNLSEGYTPAGFYRPDKKVIAVGSDSGDPRHTLLHEIGHALTLDEQYDAAVSDDEWAKMEAAANPANNKLPFEAREHLSCYDEPSWLDEALAEAYVSYVWSDGGADYGDFKHWPPAIRRGLTKILAVQAAVAKMLRDRQRRLEGFLNGTVDGEPAHIDVAPARAGADADQVSDERQTPGADQSADSSAPAESPALAELYKGLTAAHMQHEDLLTQLRDDVAQLDQAESQLQDQRAQTDEQDAEALQRIDAQLEQIEQARRAARDQLDDEDASEDQHPHRQGQPDQRAGDGDHRDAG